MSSTHHSARLQSAYYYSWITIVRSQKWTKNLRTLFSDTNMVVDFGIHRYVFTLCRVRGISHLLADKSDTSLSTLDASYLSHEILLVRHFISGFGVAVFQLTLYQWS
jgi:hypothetical protein